MAVRKRFGQHFLTDRAVICRTSSPPIRPQADDVMVEIGPGLGALTTPLAAVLRHPPACDRNRPRYHRASCWRAYPPERAGRCTQATCSTSIFFSPALSPGELRVVGNLPYNISTPLLFHLRALAAIRDMHFMLQKEVVERMVAPGGDAYGRLTVMLAAVCQSRALAGSRTGRIPACAEGEFAAWLRLTGSAAARPNGHKAQLYGAVVLAAFTQRRKTLRNALQRYLTGGRRLLRSVSTRARARRNALTGAVRFALALAAEAVLRLAPCSLYRRLLLSAAVDLTEDSERGFVAGRDLAAYHSGTWSPCMS